jgi:hypothetical protein
VQVVKYDGAANWAPKDTGFSNVAVYHHQANNTYRVVGLDGKTNQVRVQGVCMCMCLIGTVRT